MCSAARSSGRSVWRHSNTISSLLRGRLEQRRVHSFRDDAVVAREAAAPPRRPSPRTSRAARRSSRAASRAARAPGGYARRSGERNVATVRLSASRSARYERLGSAGSNPWTTSKRPVRARARGSRARRPERRRGCGARSAPRDRDDELAVLERAVALRVPREARSAARLDDATIVTACPRTRSSWAIPATCSFTSCGCDQAKGVTRQMRSAIAPESSPGGCDPQPASRK